MSSGRVQKEGPRCYSCGGPIRLSRARWWRDARGGLGAGRPTRWEGYVLDEHGIPCFCALRCATAFAAILVAAGRRLERKGVLLAGGSRSAAIAARAGLLPDGSREPAAGQGSGS